MAKEQPPGFPQNTIQVQRALVSVFMSQPNRLEEAFARIYEASFVHRKEVHKLEHLKPIFEELFGQDEAAQLLEKVNQPIASAHPILILFGKNHPAKETS